MFVCVCKSKTLWLEFFANGDFIVSTLVVKDVEDNSFECNFHLNPS